MTQAERDRLVALKKAKKKLITQKQAGEEPGITERHVRLLLRALKRRGDEVIAPWTAGDCHPTRRSAPIPNRRP
jgi:hypothetical protein